LLAMIDPSNEASRNVAAKLGFEFWKPAVVDGYLDDIYRREFV
jgi:RimJ/RimL family protein N-acetyltransferase